MTDHTRWEPDPRKMGNWRAMFDAPRPTGQPPQPVPTPALEDAALDDGPDLDPKEYRPWVLQRGRSRPAMMLELRRYEWRSGLWQGWIMSYPSLQAAEYMGDRMLSLDFGTRQFVIQGTGLDKLSRHLQLGSVVMIQEYAKGVWSELTETSRIDAITRLG